MKTRSEKNKKIRKEINKEARNKKIKLFIKITSIIFITLSLILGYGYFIGSKVTLVNEFKITNDTLPISFHGIKVVHISDLLYDSLNKNDLDKLITKINKLDADILIFTGNIKRKNISLEKEEINILNTFFKSLNANINKYAVKGVNDLETFSLIMENSNFKVLSNQEELLYYKDITPIKIIGFDTNNLNIDNINHDEYYTICLLHNPDKFDNIKNINCNLALAGNNLGGEIKIPFYKGILTNNKYYESYYKFNNTEFYISNGLGNNSNLRLFNKPSINLYRLTKY